MGDDLEQIRRKSVVAVVDFDGPVIHPNDAPPRQRRRAGALSPAGAVLPLRHGKGVANASPRWVASVEQQHKDVAAKRVADLRLDIDDLESKVLELAQYSFAAPSA